MICILINDLQYILCMLTDFIAFIMKNAKFIYRLVSPRYNVLSINQFAKFLSVLSDAFEIPAHSMMVNYGVPSKLGSTF